MELRRLRYFSVLAEELSFRKAAEKLHMAQSPLSQQIRKLEDEVGVKLFNRTNRHVSLTHAGKIFLTEARAILARSRSALERVQNAAEGKDGVLKVGYLTSLTNEKFSTAMTKYRVKCPNVELSLFDMVPDAILQALGDRSIDVGFIRAPFYHDEYHAVRIWRERLMVALPKSHWLAGRGAVATKFLAEETFIMVPDRGSMGLNENIKTMCLKAGFYPRQRLTVNQMQAAIWLVDLSFGVAVVPASLQGVYRENVVYQPISDSPLISAYMLWRKDDHSPVVAEFCRFVHATLSGRNRFPSSPRRETS